MAYIAALLAALVGSGTFFKISDIQVTGNVIYSSQEILDIAGVTPGSNLFLINKREIESAILENCGFVDTVTFIRHFPDTLEICIRESKLLTCVEYNGTYYVLNRKAMILSQTDAAGAAGHILITGIEPLEPEVGEELELGAAESAKKDYLTDVLEQLLEKELYSQVQWIDVSSVASLKLRYQERITVNLGKNEELARKFAMLESILADRAENDRGTIDLSQVGEGHFIPEQ